MRKALQTAFTEDNPMLQDPDILLEKYGLDLGSYSPEALRIRKQWIEEGEFSLTAWPDSDSEFTETTQPRIKIEGKEVSSIYLTKDHENHYRLTLDYLSEDSEKEDLHYIFSFSSQGEGFKQRETFNESGPENKEMTFYDIEIAGIAVNFLKRCLDQALSASETPTK